MDFLALANALRQETGVAESAIGDVTNVTGDMKRLVDWISLSYAEIQVREPDWYFLKQVDTSLTTTGQTVALPVDFASPIALTLTRNGAKSELNLLDRAAFDEKYRTTVFQSGVPSEWCVEGSNIKFSAIPDDTYVLTLEYTQTPHVMTVNASEPLIPARWHYIIVYNAMIHWGMYDTANEIVQRGMDGFNRMYAELTLDQTPQIAIYGAIA